MAELWYPLAITQAQEAGGYEIVLTTDRPCHLWLYWTMNPPWVHRITRLERGLSVPWDAYWCYTSWTLIEQDEGGDTTTHTFQWPGWVNCQTKYFRFHGTIGGVNSPSDSPIFWKHYLWEAPPVPPIEYLYPTGVGLHNGLGWETPPGIPHWQAVTGTPPDEASYVQQFLRVADLDTYLTQDSAYGENITKVVIHYRVRGAPPNNYFLPVLLTYTLQYGVRTFTQANWVNYEQVYVLNPWTGNPWTLAEVNAMQLGIAMYCWWATPEDCCQIYAAIHRSV